MQVIRAGFGMVRAFCLMLILALSVAPAVEAAHHGPGAQAVETNHHAFHFEHGHGHGTAPADHHDASDHDHVSTVVLIGEGTTLYPEPDRLVQPGPAVSSGFPPDGPRRPPRPMMI